MIGALTQLVQYRIIFQYNTNKSSVEWPPHVRAMSWLPQSALLAHNSTRLFVTHVGVKSMTESICNGMPTLIVPFCADQMVNGMYLSFKNAGVVVEKNRFSEHNFMSAVKKVLEDVKFAIAAKKLRSYNTKGSLMNQEKLAVFWAEFSLRHASSMEKFTKRRGIIMSHIQYHNVDVIFLTLFFISSFALSCLYFTRFLCNLK